MEHINNLCVDLTDSLGDVRSKVGGPQVCDGR